VFNHRSIAQRKFSGANPRKWVGFFNAAPGRHLIWFNPSALSRHAG
jgi:hypothetical protein